MEEIPLERVTNQQNKTSPNVVVSVLVAMLLAGGGVYAYQKCQMTKAQADLQAQIESLKSDLATVKQAAIRPATDTTSVSVATAPPPLAATPNATPAVLKTYTNSTFKFTIKYPNDWKVVSDTIQKSITADSKTGEGLYLGLSTSTSSNVMDHAYIGVVVNHGGFDPEVVKNTYDATYTNGKLVLGNKMVSQSDVYQPDEGSFVARFKVGSTWYSISGGGLTETQFKDIATSFSAN